MCVSSEHFLLLSSLVIIFLKVYFIGSGTYEISVNLTGGVPTSGDEPQTSGWSPCMPSGIG